MKEKPRGGSAGISGGARVERKTERKTERKIESSVKGTGSFRIGKVLRGVIEWV